MDDAGDGRSVVGDQSGKRGLIDARLHPDGGEGRVLYGREVIACIFDRGMEDCHRDLLWNWARQVPLSLLSVTEPSMSPLTRILIGVSVLIDSATAF